MIKMVRMTDGTETLTAMHASVGLIVKMTSRTVSLTSVDSRCTFTP